MVSLDILPHNPLYEAALHIVVIYTIFHWKIFLDLPPNHIVFISYIHHKSFRILRRNFKIARVFSQLSSIYELSHPSTSM